MINAKKTTKVAMVHSQKKASPVLGHFLAGGIVCGGVMAGLLCAGAALLCRIDIPLEFTVPISTGILCISVMAGAMVISFLHGKGGMLCGLVFSCLVLVLVGVFSVTQAQPVFSTFTAIKACSILLCGGAGGYIGILWKESKQKLS